MQQSHQRVGPRDSSCPVPFSHIHKLTLASLKRSLNPESSDFRLGRCLPSRTGGDPVAVCVRLPPLVWRVRFMYLFEVLEVDILWPRWVARIVGRDEAEDDAGVAACPVLPSRLRSGCS